MKRNILTSQVTYKHLWLEIDLCNFFNNQSYQREFWRSIPILKQVDIFIIPNSKYHTKL